MSKATEKAKQAVIEAIDKQCCEMGADEYREALDEISAHIHCLIDCWEEENKE